MNICVRKGFPYYDVTIKEGNTSIALGLHTVDERKDLAKRLLHTVEELLAGIEEPE